MSSRLAVLALHARADVFVGDAGLEAAAGRLERAGHDVLRWHVDCPDEPGARPAFLADLEAKAAGGALDAIVLAHVWDEPTLDALRRGLGDAKLVRLAPGGIPAALDHRFDAVVDVEG